MNQNLERVAANLLGLWAAEKTSLFMIFKVSKNSGGSTSCVIDTFSPDVLKLSWPGENKFVRRGEFVISLKGVSPVVSDIDLPEVVSGGDFVNPSEPFVLIALPSGDRFWLVPSRGFELDDAFKLSERAVGENPKDSSAPDKGEKVNDQMTVTVSFGSKQRKATIKVGKEYVVQPLNILKKKHRNRRCVVLGFVPVSDSHPRDIVAKVRFLDNNRIGRTELDDLVSVR